MAKQRRVSSFNTLRAKKKFNLRRALPIVAIISIVGGTIVWRSFAAEPISVPSEFISRGYTEALGRMPDQQGWNYWQNQFETKGCNVSTFARYVNYTYRSGGEFDKIPYNNQEKLLAIYRGVLSRDPDSSGYQYWLRKLNSGMAASSVVNSMVGGHEFSSLVDGICSSSNTNIVMKGEPLAIEGSMSQATLQAKLNAAKPGSIVAIPRGVLVEVEARLTVPTGVTLTTEGSEGIQGRQAYASMGRIVYKPTSAKIEKASIVIVQNGASLKNVWIDGQMWNYPSKDGGQNIHIAPSGSLPARVEFVRSDNPRAAQNIVANTSAGECLADVQIRSNLVINSANTHVSTRWADGIATVCANATVDSNEVLDASDVAIIVFRTFGSAPQASKVTNNKILQAGNDAFGGLVTDPLSTTSTPRPYPQCLNEIAGANATCDFSGTVFQGNTLWTGKDARFVIGISVGTRAWGFFKPDSADGGGATFIDNTAGESQMNTQIPVYVSGVYNAVVKNNFVGSKINKLPGKSSSPGSSCKTQATVAANSKFISSKVENAVISNNDECI